MIIRVSRRKLVMQIFYVLEADEYISCNRLLQRA